jgi:hypothetical protein
MNAPKANINGHWEVNVAFFNSNSKHILFLEQEGNWIHGSHQSDFSTHEVIGMIDGDEIKLRSNYRKPGDAISYWFSGKIEDDNISGSIYMGEYLTADFAARPLDYKLKPGKINIPGGPPLAT